MERDIGLAGASRTLPTCHDVSFLSVWQYSAHLAVFIGNDKVRGLVLGRRVTHQSMCVYICLPWRPGVRWRGLAPPETPISPVTTEQTDNSLVLPAVSPGAAGLGNSTLLH